MKKFKLVALFIILSCLLACCKQNNNESVYVKQPMDTAAAEAFLNERKDGDLPVFFLHDELYYEFVAYPSMDLLLKSCPSANLFRVTQNEEKPITGTYFSDSEPQLTIYRDGVAHPYSVQNFAVTTDMVNFLGYKNEVEARLKENGFDVTVEDVAVILNGGYILNNFAWIKCSDCSLFITFNELWDDRYVLTDEEWVYRVYTHEQYLEKVKK